MVSASLGRPSPPRSSRSRGWAVTAILLVMAALTAGWPLIDTALADGESLRDGTVLVLGPGDDTVSLRVVGAGWVLSKSASDPDMAFALSRDGVDVDADYVQLAENGKLAQLWHGLRKVQSVVDSDSRLGEPRPVTSTTGAAGATGTLFEDGSAGTATVWLAPDRSYAVAITVLAEPGSDPAAVADGAALALGVSFPGGPL